LIRAEHLLQMQGTQVQVGAFEANPTFVEMENEGSFIQYDLEWPDFGPFLEEAVKVKFSLFLNLKAIQ